jgi:AAA domain-containing protein
MSAAANENGTSVIPLRSKLRAVTPKAAEPSKPKILIFGKPGVGKTWAALDFPSVFYIDTEGGADLAHYTDKLERAGGVYLGPAQGSLSFDTVLDQVRALATEDHPFRTLVIDSISKLFNVEIADEAERLGDKDVFGASKKSAIAYMRRLVSWLQRLDMNVILIAHEKAEWGMVKGQRTEVGSTFDAWDRLGYELHLILNIVKSGSSRAAKVGKSRLLGFPEASSFPWSYSEFAQRYGRDVIEKDAVKIVLATPAQIAEVKRLVEIVKLPEGTVEKWWKKAEVDDWAEMQSEIAGKCIASLRAKLLEMAEEAA